MNTKYSYKNLDLVNLLFLTLTPVGAIVGTFYWLEFNPFHWGQIFLGIFFYLLTGLSITAGYHRLMAHRAYDAHPLIKLFFLIFGAASFQNSALKWCADHRLHHHKVDTNEDPYGINEGFFYAHMGWIFLKKNGTVQEKFAKDFRKDPLIMWQHKYYIPIAVVVGLILPTLLGGYFFGSYLGGLAVAGFGRIVLTHHCTFFINSLCHYLGSTPYTDTNTAKDSWFMALLTFGEGYHNFHHFFQNDYRNGIRWFHFDPTKWLIKFLNYFHLTDKLRVTSKEKILAAKMQMKIQSLKNKVSASDKFWNEVEKIKLNALETMKNLESLKEEYQINKAAELRARIKASKEEFNRCMYEWENLINNYRLIEVYAR